MSAPKRIQRKRTKGWKMPEGAIYVGRPTKWGNPANIEELAEAYSGVIETEAGLRELAVSEYLSMFTAGELAWDTDDARSELGGHHLACWCPLDQPCHADVLLQIANATRESDPQMTALTHERKRR